MPSSPKKFKIWLLGTDKFYSSDADSLIAESSLTGDDVTIGSPNWLELNPLAVEYAKAIIENDMIAQDYEYKIPLEPLFTSNSGDMEYYDKLQSVLSKRFLYLSTRGTGQSSTTYYHLTLHPSGKFIHIRKNAKSEIEWKYEESSINMTFHFKKYKEAY